MPRRDRLVPKLLSVHIGHVDLAVREVLQLRQHLPDGGLLMRDFSGAQSGPRTLALDHAVRVDRQRGQHECISVVSREVSGASATLLGRRSRHDRILVERGPLAVRNGPATPRVARLQPAVIGRPLDSRLGSLFELHGLAMLPLFLNGQVLLLKCIRLGSLIEEVRHSQIDRRVPIYFLLKNNILFLVEYLALMQLRNTLNASNTVSSNVLNDPRYFFVVFEMYLLNYIVYMGLVLHHVEHAAVL